MNTINCSVCNCSHNSNNTCYANRINVAGKGAKNSIDTCCGSFLDEKLYSNLTNNTNEDGNCTALVCNVDTCAHNENSMCVLDNISVSGDSSTKIYNETQCNSFDLK